jgi:hypothetical protein
MPPLRGCCHRILIVLFHRQNSFPVATRSLKGPLYPDTLILKSV